MTLVFNVTKIIKILNMILQAAINRIGGSKTAINLASKLTYRPIYGISQKDQRFLRFIDFDAKYLSQIPWVFTPLKPYIYFVRDAIFEFNQIVGLPWWVVILLTSITSRVIIFPLIFIQMKKMSRIGPVWPVFAHIKEAWKDSSLPLMKRIKTCWNLYRKMAYQQKFRLRSVFVYNLAYYPILICMIFSLRSLFSIEAVAQSGFFYLNNLADIDPYYILPTLTVAAYYWNFERFITPENKHTLISKIRSLCQVFLIIWYPFLCCWPSGIVMYMFCNSIISIIQSSVTTSMWFQSKLNPKIMHYNYMLSTVQHDKSTSESIVHAIKTGEESIKEKAIKEEVLFQQTEKMIKNLNKEQEKQKKDEKDQDKQAKMSQNNDQNKEQDAKKDNQNKNNKKEQQKQKYEKKSNLSLNKISNPDHNKQKAKQSQNQTKQSKKQSKKSKSKGKK